MAAEKKRPKSPAIDQISAGLANLYRTKVTFAVTQVKV
jgi:hypothetical protein